MVSCMLSRICTTGGKLDYAGRARPQPRRSGSVVANLSRTVRVGKGDGKTAGVAARAVPACPYYATGMKARSTGVAGQDPRLRAFYLLGSLRALHWGDQLLKPAPGLLHRPDV